jgi:parvulin-like peptidyl-prolyl isomerase
MPLTVNGQFIDDELIRNEAAALKERMRAEMPGDELELELRAREWARENVVERVLLQQAARQDPAAVPAEVIASAMERVRAQSPNQGSCLQPKDEELMREQVETELRLQRLLAQVTEKAPRPNSKEITAQYQRMKEALGTPEMVHAAHIVKNVDETKTEEAAEQEIRDIQNRLKNGAKFAEVADESSDCPGRGGDLGLFARGQMVDEFDEVVFALKPGELSDVFRTPFGFHIATVYERKPAGTRALKDVREQIEQFIWDKRREQAVARYLDELRAKADIRKVKAPQTSVADEERV